MNLQVFKTKTITFVVMIAILSSIHLAAQPNPNCFEVFNSAPSASGFFNLRLSFDTAIAVGVLPEPTYSIWQPYDGCSDAQNNTRLVAYVHGLGGNISAWDKQIKYTDSAYQVASRGVDYASSNYEISMYQVAGEINDDLLGFVNDADALQPTRCKDDDYLIAHSQGGIAARFLDWKWNTGSLSFGVRKFKGLVTFATPNGGAHVALTKNDHFAFVADVVSSVILYEANEMIYDFSNLLFGSFANRAYEVKSNLDTFIKNQLAPLMLASVHQPTLDEMAPGSNTMNSLTNHWGYLRRVAFYASEDAPECWRVMDNIVTKKAEDYPLWGAQPDETFMNKMEEVRGLHELQIEENNKDIEQMKKWRKGAIFLGSIPGILILNSKIQKKEIENIKRNEALDFLNNANTQWRYLIGSYHKDSIDVEADSLFVVHYIHPWGVPMVYRFKTRAEAQALADANNGTVTASAQSVKIIKRFYPSDGVVLTQSQKAFPGVKESDTDFMPHNNHFQVRNSEETERVLKDLFDGVNYDQYFKLKK